MMRLGNEIIGEESGGICATDHSMPIRSVQAGGADHPNCECVGENKGVGHVLGYLRENRCWWIGNAAN